MNNIEPMFYGVVDLVMVIWVSIVIILAIMAADSFWEKMKDRARRRGKWDSTSTTPSINSSHSKEITKEKG